MVTDPVTDVKIVKQTSNLPTKDADVGNTGKQTVNKWKDFPEFTLLWITQAEHEANVTNFADTLGERNSTGGGRKEITQKLSDLDTDLDNGITSIKNFLVYKYKKSNAPSYYPQFGIERVGKNFILPRDRNKRLETFPLIIAATATHGYTDEKYNEAYWLAAKDYYTALMEQASAVDGTVSTKVGTKNELRKTIVKTHNALIKLLQANYPDTYRAVMREWGFQKEKY